MCPSSEPSDNSDSDNETNLNYSVHNDLNVSNLSSASTGSSCIKNILRRLQQLDNKHNWLHESVDTLLNKYFGGKTAISKLFMYEMDIVNEEVLLCFGKTLFKKSDSKQIRITKMYNQLRKMPQLLNYESSDEEPLSIHQPKSLKEIYLNFIVLGKYPKEYLVAIHCEINHIENVSNWEAKSPIPMTCRLPWINAEHTIFNYPEVSVERHQMEMRTFDYTHILNNLRFHICNKGFDNVSTAAFVDVSNHDHDVLPTAIVEDKMDRQNSTISQRFFSKDVQKILTLLQHDSEA